MSEVSNSREQINTEGLERNGMSDDDEKTAKERVEQMLEETSDDREIGVVEGGPVQFTNDDDEIQQAQEEGNLADPDHRPDEPSERLGDDEKESSDED
ncbi:hypothetical protein SAMN05216226_12024 [Halovenus aranensis]|uniref:Uncharacterized protein n=2 Tax=Halovenus aranensis TaxID=890420 RepID=A0A1G8ZBM8_9EURY|nr:hypothetical protein SAMN05216226_12024 [Halovenus aranensis]